MTRTLLLEIGTVDARRQKVTPENLIQREKFCYPLLKKFSEVSAQ